MLRRIGELNWDRHTGNAVGAAAIARHNVFYTLDGHSRAQDGPKEVEFGRAEAFANCCGSTDRAMILEEQEGTFRLRFDLCHIPFLGSDPSKRADLVFEGDRVRYSRQVIRSLFCAAGFNHTP